MKTRLVFRFLFAVLFCVASELPAATESSLSGSVLDDMGVAVSSAEVKAMKGGVTVKTGSTSTTGAFELFPIDFGDYMLVVIAPGFQEYRFEVHVDSGATRNVNVKLDRVGSKEMVVHVSAKKKLIQSSAARSSVEVSSEMIRQMPQSDQIKLPKLIASTTPGVVSGAFGQLFIRGNHANIQYQIDGVQLPDSPSNTFGEAFSPRNIDHMEIITGGIPAEYGERLAAVVNIITKTGPQEPGGSAELNYGSYNTVSPTATYGGSNAAGNLHYFASANFNYTERALDTPQPITLNDPTQGGTDSVHNVGSGHTEFLKVDWIVDNNDKLTAVAFNNASTVQFPNYPASYDRTSPYFTGAGGFTDQFGNGPFNAVPPYTDDGQYEMNAYGQVVWKHTFSPRSFLQVAPYYKYSYINVHNDRFNDQQGTQSQNSFVETRGVHNTGLKIDYTIRPHEDHLVKTGGQFQWSRSFGGFTVFTPLVPQGSGDYSPNTGTFESVYAQDDWTISKMWILNAGLRYDATQFSFSNASSTADSLQPRVGLTFLPGEKTKIHAFYGKLFQPAPVENLRTSFAATSGGPVLPYDIKPEKDDYYEVGVAQELPFEQLISVNGYYKKATDMLDDAQLLNTSIAQPFNFATGEASLAWRSRSGAKFRRT